MSAHAPPRPREATRALERFLRGEASVARRPLALATLSGALGGIVLIGEAALLARIVDAVALRGAAIAAIRPLLLPLLGLFALRAGFAAASDLAAFEAGETVARQLRARLLAHVTALGPAWSRRARTGEVVTTVTDAVDAVRAYYAGYLPARVLTAFIPLAILAYALPTDWVSALILGLTAPLVPVFMVLIGRGTEALNQAQWRRLAGLASHLFDAIEGLTTLKNFGASRAEIDGIARSADSYRRTTMAVLRVAFLSSLMLEFLSAISIAMVAVYVGFRLYDHAMRFTPGLAVLILAPEFFRPLRAMGTQYHARMEAIGAATAIVALLDTLPPARGTGTLALPPGPVREIRLEGVGFLHDATPALDGIDLVLRRGRLTALAGPSGAGKTTLSHLLLGFATPAAGRILVDGVDLAAIDPACWRARVAALPQRPTLFAGTLRENMALGRPDADDDRIRAALARAGAAPLLGRLPRGLDTVLGDRGAGLSGGELGRVALARVFLRPADLVVLDEPATGLDADTAATIDTAIATLAGECALLVIAHRAETLEAADEVVVLREGRVVAGEPPAAAAVA